MSADDDDLFLDDFNYRIPTSRDTAEPATDPSKYVEHLAQAWINERAAPDILQYERSAIDGLLAKIEEQTAIIDELDAGNDTSMIISILYQTELERVKFVLRSYLRTRISKIERFCEFILADPASKKRLSKAEVIYGE
ncbi:GINS complex subunit, partial [Gamsiella multidivaricata]